MSLRATAAPTVETKAETRFEARMDQPLRANRWTREFPAESYVRMQARCGCSNFFLTHASVISQGHKQARDQQQGGERSGFMLTHEYWIR